MVLSLYEVAWRPAGALIARTDAQRAHAATMRVLRSADSLPMLERMARLAGRVSFPRRPTEVGGVLLPHPLIVAAGLVKGDGYADEATALAAAAGGRDIIPGWRSVPALLGATEFGSFTRWPRLGHPGRVLWRRHAGRSLQNRVGLRNPGSLAAATFLSARAARLPGTWGVNLAVSPGTTSIEAGARELGEAASHFREAFDRADGGPAWYTLNLSCPNTADDPRARQTEDEAQRHLDALLRVVDRPLWLKIGPDLSPAQLDALLRVCRAAGVRAIVATNTLAAPVPGDASRSAGLSGAGLRPLALETVRVLVGLQGQGGAIDIVACGGILDGAHLAAYEEAGARAAMLYSALVFRGPLAGALILRDAGVHAGTSRGARTVGESPRPISVAGDPRRA